MKLEICSTCKGEIPDYWPDKEYCGCESPSINAQIFKDLRKDIQKHYKNYDNLTENEFNQILHDTAKKTVR